MENALWSKTSPTLLDWICRTWYLIQANLPVHILKFGILLDLQEIVETQPNTGGSTRRRCPCWRQTVFHFIRTDMVRETVSAIVQTHYKKRPTTPCPWKVQVGRMCYHVLVKVFTCSIIIVRSRFWHDKRLIKNIDRNMKFMSGTGFSLENIESGHLLYLKPYAPEQL